MPSKPKILSFSLSCGAVIKAAVPPVILACMCQSVLMPVTARTTARHLSCLTCYSLCSVKVASIIPGTSSVEWQYISEHIQVTGGSQAVKERDYFLHIHLRCTFFGSTWRIVHVIFRRMRFLTLFMWQGIDCLLVRLLTVMSHCERLRAKSRGSVERKSRACLTKMTSQNYQLTSAATYEA